ncbi:MAG: IS66 family insertion sequence element accessory protein TnpB [Ethanoligenens sp.]
MANNNQSVGSKFDDLFGRVFALDPFADALFVFCNRNRDCLKILEWDGGGFWLYLKRLERGHFRWPSSDGETIMALNSEELSCLIDGARLERKLRRNEVFEQNISEQWGLENAVFP